MVNQKDRDAVANGIGFGAGGTLQGVAVAANGQGLATGGADEDGEKSGGDHRGEFYLTFAVGFRGELSRLGRWRSGSPEMTRSP